MWWLNSLVAHTFIFFVLRIWRQPVENNFFRDFRSQFPSRKMCIRKISLGQWLQTMEEKWKGSLFLHVQKQNNTNVDFFPKKYAAPFHNIENIVR